MRSICSSPCSTSICGGNRVGYTWTGGPANKVVDVRSSVFMFAWALDTVLQLVDESHLASIDELRPMIRAHYVKHAFSSNESALASV